MTTKEELNNNYKWELTRLIIGVFHTPGILQPLLNHLRMNTRRLNSLGVQTHLFDKTNQYERLAIPFLINLPPKAHVLVHEHIRKHYSSELERYFKDENHTEETLINTLSSFVLNVLSVYKDDRIPYKEAKLFLSCTVSKKYGYIAAIFNKVIPRSHETKEASDEEILQLNKIVMDPQSIMNMNDIDVFEIIVSILTATRFGNIKEAQKIYDYANKKYLSKTRNLKNNLEKNLTNEITKSTAEGNIKAKKLKYAVNDNDIPKVSDDIEVLARCYKHYHKSHDKKAISFSDVLAVKKAKTNEWLELEKEQAIKMFPPNGKIVHFPAKHLPHLPKANEYGVWKVLEHPVKNEDKKDAHASVHVTHHVMPVYMVANLEPTKSTDINEIRTKIQHQLFNEDDFDQKLFYFSDGLFSMSENGIKKLIAHDFANSLHAWKKLNIFQLVGGLNLHIGELPDTNKRLDLSNMNQVIYRSLEQLSLTKENDISNFKDLLKNIHIEPYLIEEMQLDNLEWYEDNIDKLIKTLVSIDNIKALMDKKLADTYDKSSSDVVEIEQAIFDEKAKVQGIKQQVDEALNNYNRKFDSDIDDKIDKKYFQRARNSYIRNIKNHEFRRSLFGDLNKLIAEQNEVLNTLEKQLDKLNLETESKI